MNRVIHFELSADDPERASKFYRDAFGWTINAWPGVEPYWLVTTGAATEPGIDGAIMRRMQPGMSTVNSIDVASVEDAARKVIAAGGAVIVPKLAVPGVGWVAYCTDTEGNTIGLFQADAVAR